MAVRAHDDRARRGFRGSLAARVVVRVAIAVAVLVLIVGIASLAIDEPVRRSMERKANQRLADYSVSIGKLDLQLYRLAVDLKNVTIRQKSNPDPAVAELPRLHASVQWKALLSGHLVADFLFDQPKLYVNLTQARSEIQSPTKLKDKGWQEAALAIFPLKINSLRVRDGRVTYIDTDPDRPLRVSHLRLDTENIRNVRSAKHTYPSPISAEATLFGKGHASIDGHADFLAEPFPGLHVRYALRDVPLADLTPVTRRENLEVRGGILKTNGEIEYAPAAKVAQVDDVTIAQLHLTYVSGGTPESPSAASAKKSPSDTKASDASGKNDSPPKDEPPAASRAAGESRETPPQAAGKKNASPPKDEPAKTTAGKSDAGPASDAATKTQKTASASKGEGKKDVAPGREGKDTLALRIQRLQLTESDFVFENRSKNPPYSVSVDRLEAELTGYGSMSTDHPSVCTLRGRFLDSGAARAKVVLRPNGEQGPDFDLTTAIGDTDMRKMNPLFRAYGNFDVSAGVFSLYSEIHVDDGRLTGYVKPLFRDVKVYDPRKDRRKSLFHKAYEGLVGIVAKLLENKQRNEVATVAQLSGRVGNAKTSTLQAVGGLIQNAFFKAILPGFERHLTALGGGGNEEGKKESKGSKAGG